MTDDAVRQSMEAWQRLMEKLHESDQAIQNMRDSFEGLVAQTMARLAAVEARLTVLESYMGVTRA